MSIDMFYDIFYGFCMWFTMGVLLAIADLAIVNSGTRSGDYTTEYLEDYMSKSYRVWLFGLAGPLSAIYIFFKR